MKYFTAVLSGKEEVIGSAGAAKRFLKHHPEILTVTRYWWSGNDLIEVTEYNRVEMLANQACRLSEGQTVQWAFDHHQL